MTPEKARELTESTELSDDVIRILELVNYEIERAAKLRRGSLDLTQFIPNYGGSQRSAWFIAMDELAKRGFHVGSYYTGKAYSINGDSYAYYVKW